MTGSKTSRDWLLASSEQDSDVLVGTAGLFSNPPPVASSTDLEEERQRAINGSLKDKIDYLQSRAIMTPAFTQALEQATFLVLKSSSDLYPGGLVVTGEGGCGKSYLVQQLVKRFPRHETLYESQIPVAHVELSGTPDEKEVLHVLLCQLGEDANKDKFSSADLEAKIIEACRRVRCRCLVFDEAQRLGTVARSRREQDRLMGPLGERIKRIHNGAGVGVILAGTPGLGDLVDSDSQYRTRWPGRVVLKPFERSGAFLSVLGSYERILPLPERSQLATPKIGDAVWVACGGYMRTLSRLLCDAMLVAVKEDARSISLSHLEEAYYLTSDAEQGNPFAALRGAYAAR